MVKVLELFSGTRSIGKCCDALGWESYSVDLEAEADFKGNIMDFDYKQFPKDEFDVVWASPPCTNYSHLKKCWYGRKLKNGIVYTKEQNALDQDEADILVLKTLEIIKYFDCEMWFMENPQTGNMKNREIMKGIPFYDVDYCMYSDWGYKKRTRIWTNKEDWIGKLCDKSGACGNMIEIPTDGGHESLKTMRRHQNILANGYEMIDGKMTLCNTKEAREKRRQHKQTCVGGRNTRDKGMKTVGSGTTLEDRYRIPPDLIYSLFLE